MKKSNEPAVRVSARTLIREHGARAAALAASRVTQMQEHNNAAGVVAWGRILTAIEELQTPAPSGKPRPPV